MVNSGSPALTHCPSLKCSVSMKPETRARTETIATASKRPEYSSHWVTCRASGSETETGVAGGPPCASAIGESDNSRAAMARRRWTDNQASPAHCGARDMWLQCSEVSIVGAPYCSSRAVEFGMQATADVGAVIQCGREDQ